MFSDCRRYFWLGAIASLITVASITLLWGWSVPATASPLVASIEGGRSIAQGKFLTANSSHAQVFTSTDATTTTVILPLVLRRWPPVPYQPTLYPISNPDGDGSYTVAWEEQPARLADTYTLEEATSPDFTSGLSVVCTTAQQSCNVSGRLAGTYYYRVRGHNAWASEPYSNIETATVLLPGTPYLNPIDNADGDQNYIVTWTASERATSYRLQEDTSPGFPVPEDVYEGPDLSWSAISISPSTRYYRVRAYGPTGWGSWSNIQSVTVPEQPTADLYIHSLVYDQSDERVEIRNRGNGAQDMTNWRIHSVVGDQWYDFPSGYTLGAGQSVRVHSGPDALDNPPSDLLWGYAYIWRNEGDKAVLYDDLGQEVDSSCYGNGCP
jgi:hypothetical protein